VGFRRPCACRRLRHTIRLIAEAHVGRIVVSQNVSLDGVVEDLAGDEGFARGGWVGLLSAREPKPRRLVNAQTLGEDIAFTYDRPLPAS